MANKVMLELEAAEKVVVADLRIASLLAQSKITEFQKKAEADFKALQQDAQSAAGALYNKLKEFSTKAKIDSADLLFDIDKYYFYVKTEFTEKVEDGVKTVEKTIDAEIKKGEAEAKVVEAAVVKEVAAAEADVKSEVSAVEAEIKKVL